eukprot:6625031-Prymnesium_polylepis.2
MPAEKPLPVHPVDDIQKLEYGPELWVTPSTVRSMIVMGLDETNMVHRRCQYAAIDVTVAACKQVAHGTLVGPGVDVLGAPVPAGLCG